MSVYANRDSQPVVFLLTSGLLGRKRITIDFYHKGRMIASTDFETEVVPNATVRGSAPLTLSESLDMGELAANPPPPADLELRVSEGRHLFEHVQDMAAKAAGRPGTVGLVAGLTNIRDEYLAKVADIPLLVPGFGAQGGDLGRLRVSERAAPLLVNASRSILFAQPERSFADKAREAAEQIGAALGRR